MKKNVLLALLVCSGLFAQVYAQNSGEQTMVKVTVEKSKADFEAFKEEQNAELERRMEEIEQQFEEGVITEDEMIVLNFEASKKMNEELEAYKKEHGIEDENRVVKMRNYGNLVWGFGFNNVLVNGSLNDSPYRGWGSRYFELGYGFSSNLTEDGKLRVNYSLLFQFNGLKPVGNMYHIKEGDNVKLVQHSENLSKSKLRMDNLTLPVHLDFGGKEFRGGIGGYVGMNLNTVQKLKYKNDQGSQKDKDNSSYNATRMLYGVSAYVSYYRLALLVRYEVNPLFKNEPAKMNNFSVGLRMGF